MYIDLSQMKVSRMAPDVATKMNIVRLFLLVCPVFRVISLVTSCVKLLNAKQILKSVPKRIAVEQGTH